VAGPRGPPFRPFIAALLVSSCGDDRRTRISRRHAGRAGRLRRQGAGETWRKKGDRRARLARRRARRYRDTAMARRIALVEDDPAIRANYTDALARQGYEVAAHASRREALAAFSARLPDLAILDIGLGAEVDGGFTLCRELRALSDTLPILFLTARDSDFDTVAGLRLGADDYLTKDVSLPHLLARIAALFRRVDALTSPANREETLERGPLRLDAKRLEVAWQGRAVPLTVTEFWMVHALARHPGHVKTRDQLMSDARLTVDDATITSHVKRIRRKFLAADPDFTAIEAVYGAGYRWRA
jgi:two-component system OmpR family response regulator